VVQRSQIDFSSERPTGPLSSGGTIEGRGGKLYFVSGTFELIVTQALLDGEPLSFEPIPDTVRVRTLPEFRTFVQTTPFGGNGSLYLELQYVGSGSLSPDLTAGVVLRDASTGELLSTLRSFSGTRDTVETLTIPLSFGTRSVRLGVEPLGRIPPIRGFELHQWFLVGEDSSMVLKPAFTPPALVTGSASLPTAYALHAAYPNPFNPSTEIRFDLPEASKVSLVVYDLLGQKVAVVADGFYGAGYRSVRWNAGDASTSMYLARITVLGPSGEVKLAKTI
jgi:hypothetical protein